MLFRSTAACVRGNDDPAARRGASGALMKWLTLALTLGIACAGPVAVAQAEVTTPASHFGFQLGADGKYASWEQNVAYYKKLDAESDRVQTRVIGTSTLGQPFLVVTVSSPENLAKATRYQEIARKLADPRGLTVEQTNALAAEGKVVVMVSLGQHSTEVASSQVGPLLVHRLATSNDAQTRAILDNAILVLIPSFNPDGQVMVKAWVDKTAGTPFQGTRTPDLYHHYAGHDNNRDAYMLNLAESKLWTKVAYEEWFPQIYKDTHQMGSDGARIFLPPKTDPILPDVDPIVWRETMLLGAGMATNLEAAGVTGVETQVGSYTGWQMPTFHGMTPSRNIVGYHTESASAKMIWPLEQTAKDLRGADRGRPGYYPQVNFPHPWPAGVWRMGDIVRQQEIAILGTLETAARHREMFLSNMALMARRQVERGATQAPYAHVIPLRQQDPGTTAKLVSILMEAKVEVHRAPERFQVGGTTVEAGDYVIRSDQPLRGYIHSLLVPYIYPDNPWTRRADGAPLRPKDFASTNLGELMGVKVVPIAEPLSARLEPVTVAPKMAGQVTGSGSAGWLLTPTWNDSFRAVTQILQAGGQVYRLSAPPQPWAPGTFWIPAGRTNAQAILKMSQEFGLPFEAVGSAPTAASYALKPLRVGLYRRYAGGNADEGWTRWLFDTWKFPYTRVDASMVQAGKLNGRYDVLIVPDDGVSALMGGGPPGGEDDDELPPEYSKTLGERGLEALKTFARNGGTLVFLGGSSELAVEKFGIPVKNVVAGLSTKQFYAPGSMLHVNFDPTQPLAYGMPAEGLVLYDFAPTFDVDASAAPGSVSIPGRYPQAKLLESGWLDGEKYIANKPALLDVGYGKGRLALIGFGPQTRGETHGTFKVLFNAMYLNGAPRPAGK
jgi:hypothetical protein